MQEGFLGVRRSPLVQWVFTCTFLFTSPEGQLQGLWLETIYEHYATVKTSTPYGTNPL